ncbi:MAG: hypothetical protein PUH30_12380 [Oscillospiraceae bacterium]|nr:hypothetical protein [Oscillospiraceae bacterium]
MKFNNLNDLFNHIEADIQDTMVNEVAETVKEEMVIAVETSVYRVYDPVQYNRRYGNGGLGARENMHVEEIPNGIYVRDIAPLDNGRTDYALDDIVVNGLGRMPFPRDFYSECEEQLFLNENHKEALKQGLKNRGYNVK